MWAVVQPVLEHWLSSGCSGLLGYCSISIIFRSSWRAGFRSRPTTFYTTPEDRCIGRLSSAVGFGCSIAAHLWVDFVAGHGWLG